MERKGDKYTLYNYKTNNLSKEMKREDINKFLRDYSNQKEEYLAAERERLEVEQKRRAEFEGIETMLRDNVSEYIGIFISIADFSPFLNFTSGVFKLTFDGIHSAEE